VTPGVPGGRGPAAHMALSTLVNSCEGEGSWRKEDLQASSSVCILHCSVLSTMNTGLTARGKPGL
jgi:hypothetical protein